MKHCALYRRSGPGDIAPVGTLQASSAPCGLHPPPLNSLWRRTSLLLLLDITRLYGATMMAPPSLKRLKACSSQRRTPIASSTRQRISLPDNVNPRGSEASVSARFWLWSCWECTVARWCTARVRLLSGPRRYTLKGTSCGLMGRTSLGGQSCWCLSMG